jgi:two-component system sensor histidine kinase/response regulator
MPKILVIDDEEAFRGYLITMLEKKGFDVLQAPSGAIGVQLARTHLPDLILCDVNMGGVGGNLTLYALRRDPQIASIPFILMSGFLSGADTPPGIERGADGFLSKPFSIEKLVSMIQGCLGEPEPTSAAAKGLSARPQDMASLDSSSGLLETLRRILDITRLIGSTGRPLQPKETFDLAGKAHEAASLLHRRIENCLLYAEIERLASDWQQAASLQEHRTGIHEIVESVARAKARKLERTADLELRIDDALAAISADSLKKIMEELLDNAFRYSLPGKVVHLKTAVVAGHVALSITDQGSGMTPEQVAQAGGPIPLDQVLLAQQGSGLGLSISRRLIELHRGTLIIHSKPGRGTTVTVTLLKSPVS